MNGFPQGLPRSHQWTVLGVLETWKQFLNLKYFPLRNLKNVQLPFFKFIACGLRGLLGSGVSKSRDFAPSFIFWHTELSPVWVTFSVTLTHLLTCWTDRREALISPPLPPTHSEAKEAGGDEGTHLEYPFWISNALSYVPKESGEGGGQGAVQGATHIPNGIPNRDSLWSDRSHLSIRKEFWNLSPASRCSSTPGCTRSHLWTSPGLVSIPVRAKWCQWSPLFKAHVLPDGHCASSHLVLTTTCEMC